MSPTTPASEWKTANRKEVTLPSGRTVLIRKLSGQLWLSARDIFEGLLAAGETGDAKLPEQIRLTPEQNKQFVELLLQESVLRPKIAPTSREPAEDEVHPADFGPDLDPLVAAIQEFSPEILQVPFRPPTGGDGAAPGGPGLRGAAEPASPGDAGGPAPRPGDPGPGGSGDAGIPSGGLSTAVVAE